VKALPGKVSSIITKDMMPRSLTILSSLLFSLMLAACTAAPEKPLRLGTNVWIGYEPFYLAREINALDQDKVRLIEYTSSLPVLHAFRNGLLDAAALTLDEALLLSQQLPDISVVAVLDISNGADALLSRPEFSDIRQLSGKTVAVENLATGGYLLLRALQQAGMSPNAVTIKAVSADNHEAALEAKDIAAVVSYDPQKTRMLANGAHNLFDSSQIPGEIVDVLVVRKHIQQQKPHMLRHLLKGWQIAHQYLQRNRREALVKMQPRQKLNAAQIEGALQQLSFPDKAQNQILLGQSGQLHKTLQRLRLHMQSSQLLSPSAATPLTLDPSWLQE
jgi:NitT/TauT family transport system substrate-binding protein